MRMYVYDLANALTRTVFSPKAGEITRAEKHILDHYGARAYRLADTRYDASLLNDVRMVASRYDIRDTGRVILYDNPFPNAAYMRHSNTLLISTSLLQEMNQEETRAVLAHEFWHRKQRGFIRLARTILVATGVAIATFTTIKCKDTLAGAIKKNTTETSLIHKAAHQLEESKSFSALVIGGLYASVGYGMHWLMEIPEAALKRRIELDADKNAAKVLRNPDVLADALEKINHKIKQSNAQIYRIPPTDPQAQEMMPPELSSEEQPGDFLKTIDEMKRHYPSIEERIARLREMGRQQRSEEGVAHYV